MLVCARFLRSVPLLEVMQVFEGRRRCTFFALVNQLLNANLCALVLLEVRLFLIQRQEDTMEALEVDSPVKMPSF